MVIPVTSPCVTIERWNFLALSSALRKNNQDYLQVKNHINLKIASPSIYFK